MDSTLEELFSRPESHRLDFKESPKLDDDDDLARHLVAFANRHGGQLVFGVTDNHELEGRDLNIEKALRSVRTVSRVRCDPPVEFEERVFEDQEFNGERGDVLIIDIKPGKSSPHAVVTGGNTETRRFYIRTADESRLITDAEELRQLFTGSSDPSFIHTFRTSVTHGLWTYEPVRLRPSMRAWGEYRQFFRNLSADARQKLKASETEETDDGSPVKKLSSSDEEELGSRMIREVFPLVLFNSFRHYRLDHWILESTSNEGEYDAIEQGTEEVGVTDFEMANEPEVLKQLDIDLRRATAAKQSLLYVPRGTDITGHPPADEDDPAVLKFEKENRFTLEIGLFRRERPRNILGTPLEYPGRVSNEDDAYTRVYPMVMEADMGFPEVEDPDIRLHRAFTEEIAEIVRHGWDLERYANRTPDSELYRIGEKVDRIEELIEQERNDSDAEE